MRLLPVPATKLDCLLGLITEAKEEFLHSVDPKTTLDRIKSVYGVYGFSAYVDDLDAPKHCLILQNVLGIFHPDTMTAATLVFSTKSQRGSSDFPEAATQLMSNFAQIHGSSKLIGSSWVLNGHKGIDDMWKKSGFNLQERIYSKSL